jgi:hypothetical protein
MVHIQMHQHWHHVIDAIFFVQMVHNILDNNLHRYYDDNDKPFYVEFLDVVYHKIPHDLNDFSIEEKDFS